MVPPERRRPQNTLHSQRSMMVSPIRLCYDSPMQTDKQMLEPPRPWDLHPALTEHRLRTCARLLANARRDAIALASIEMGDDSWSIGCRAFAFGRHRLLRMAEAGTYDWLRVLDDSHHFVFQIDQVPIRFYRGQADEPTTRTLKRQEAESAQLSLLLGQEAADGLAFRFALETAPSGAIERVVFLALRGEDRTECFWPVPLEVASAAPPAGQAHQLRLLADDGYAGPAAPGGLAKHARLRAARTAYTAKPQGRAAALALPSSTVTARRYS